MGEKSRQGELSASTDNVDVVPGYVDPAQDDSSSVALRTKLYFGIGAGGESASMWIFNAVGLIFYQQILGLPAGLAATAMAIAIFVDAITDPLIGAVSDNFRSRFGRRHPFLFMAPIPLALCVFLIFHPPQFVVESTSLLFSWLCLFTVLQRTFQTFYVGLGYARLLMVLQRPRPVKTLKIS